MAFKYLSYHTTLSGLLYHESRVFVTALTKLRNV